MNPALLSFFPKFLLSEKTGSELTPKLQYFDETPYVANGIALDKVAGVVYSAKRENVSFYANTDFDDPDVTLDPVANVKVDLPVDATDNALYGDFEFIYKSRVYNEFTTDNDNEQIDAISASPVTAVTLDDTGYTGTLAANINALVALIGTEYKIEFLNSAGTILGTSVITSASYNGGTSVTTINCTSVAIASYALVTQIRLVSYYSETVNVSYCSQDWPTPVLVVTSDCIRAQVQVQDQTQYQASDTLTRLITLNYPVLSNGTPVASPETTSTASMLVGPNIWTGSYAIFLSSTLIRTQTDTLVLSYILEAYNPYLVECDAGLCCMRDCIGNIFTAYKNALTQGSPNLSVLRDNVITILGYVNLYQIAVNCGETEVAGTYLEDLQTYMDNIGCDCNCAGASPSAGPTIVYPLFADPQPNYVPISYIETGMIVTDSNTKVPSNKAVINYVFSNFYSKTFIDDNFYNETETDALLAANFYTKTEGDARYILQFDKTKTAAGESPVTLNQRSGIVDIAASDAPIIVGATTTYRIDNSFCVANGFVIAQIDSQVNPASTMQIIEIKSYDGYFTVKCKNIGTEQLDDSITIQFLIA
jgi:hypothetical protein